MKKNRDGFTLVELLVVVAIIAILIALLIPAFNNNATNKNVQYGAGGTTEVRCIDGFKCVVGPRGHVTQLIDQDGKPVVCLEQP